MAAAPGFSKLRPTFWLRAANLEGSRRSRPRCPPSQLPASAMFPSPSRLAAPFALFLCATHAAADTWYVRHDAPPGGDGRNWTSAFTTVQDSLSAAQHGDQVWVARATYRPGNSASPTTVSFDLPAGVAVYGGFIGTELALAERDPRANPTHLSGDLLGDDAPGFVNRADNCQHVVRVVSTGGLLDGFVIRGGNAVSGPEPDGGGLLVFGEVTLRDVIIEDNEAAQAGGGLNVSYGRLLLERSTLRANRAGYAGGAAYVDNGEADFVACRVLRNEATHGGGLAFEFDFGTFVSSVHDSVIVGNVASSQGGGVRTFYGSATLRGTLVAFNHAASAGGVAIGGGGGVSYANAIVWGNTAQTGTTLSQQIGNANPPLGSAVQGAPAPWNEDPRWSDPFGPDGVAGTADDDFRLSCLSPYIDRGANSGAGGSTHDLAGNRRFLDDPATPDLGTGTAPIVDLGPFEFVCGCADVALSCVATPNSTGRPAALTWSGSTSVFANDITLRIVDAPPTTFAHLFYGPEPASAPLGDGVRCVGGALFRAGTFALDANGAGAQRLDVTLPPANSGPGQVLAGSTWYFQCVYRDLAGGPAGFNASNALVASFCP
jgi:hypothetical protein